MTNRHKEKIMFELKNEKFEIILDNEIPKEIVSDIHHIYNNKEEVYYFESGDMANFLYERSCVNDLSFNYFQLYNKSSYKCLKKIKSNIIKICEKIDINIDKNYFFISSEYETNLLHNFVYDCGGYGNFSFFGYWFLEVEDDSYIIINDEKYNISTGDILISTSNSKIQFYKISKAISFNISTLNNIKSQYPQKWMPLFLS